MGLYTKIDKKIDNYYEIVSMNKSLSKQNVCSKFLVLLFFVPNVFVTIKGNVYSIHNPITFSLDDVLFNNSLFISSITLVSGNYILFSKISILLSFCSISKSISSIVSPIIFLMLVQILYFRYKHSDLLSIAVHMIIQYILQGFVIFRFEPSNLSL